MLAVVLAVALAQTPAPVPPVTPAPTSTPPACCKQEYTPILYAAVPTLLTSGQEFHRATILGAWQPPLGVLTYTLYQVDTKGQTFRVLANDISWTSPPVTAQLRYGLCFVLSQEPSMTYAEMKSRIDDMLFVWSDKTGWTKKPTTYGAGMGGVPAGPGCAIPHLPVTAASLAADTVLIVAGQPPPGPDPVTGQWPPGTEPPHPAPVAKKVSK